MRAREFTKPTAAGCILYAEDTGRWGLQQRSDTVNDPGLWAAWGGGRDPGESLEQCVRRELAEESGYSGPIKLEPLARNAKYVTFIGIVPHEFEPKPCDEWKDYCWVELGKWPSPMHPGVAAALENVYIKENLAEAFNQPYPIKWEKSEHGDYDALATLSDGTHLSIMFEHTTPYEVEVSFWRNNSLEVTGEGDAQRVFATVLNAIQQFLKIEQPANISFSASKEVEPGQNSESRAKLYNRLVDRYAAAWGYNSRHFDHGDQVTYELTQYPSDGPFESVFTENFADGGNPVKFTVTSPDGYKHSFQITLAVHGKHVGHFNFVRSADTDDVNNEAEVESRWQGQGYGKLLLMKAIDVANNHGLDFQQDIRGITDAQQNVYDSLENAGLIVTPGDGFWFLTPQGEQELNGLNENFADGKKPGRKGLSRRVGIPKKASLSKLQKIASSSTGERRRMAQWQLNMRRGKAKKK